MSDTEEELSIVKSRARVKLERELGPVFLEALRDPRTVELMLNPDGRLWQERLGERMKCIGSMRWTQAQSVIMTVAGYHGKEITKDQPLLECEFPLDGSRFAAQLPPVVPEATFALRKKAVAIFTLDDYVRDQIMTASHCDTIRTAVTARKNILVVGGTGSGKTTLANAIIGEMVTTDPAVRLLIIEDTGEIQCPAQNHIQYHTSLEVSMRMLLKVTLRMRPDRIVVGEVRGPEALDLLMTWNTGHPGGVATLHANDANAGLSRMSMLISMHPDAPEPIEPLIGEAVDMVVHIARATTGPVVREIIEVVGYGNGAYITRNH